VAIHDLAATNIRKSLGRLTDSSERIRNTKQEVVLQTPLALKVVSLFDAVEIETMWACERLFLFQR
jgi:hypothetical protein